MKPGLLSLIHEYQAAVEKAVSLLVASGIELPSSDRRWAFNGLPGRGVLKGGEAYFKHGYGCKVQLPIGTVDFDFGRQGQIDGIDLWKMIMFAGDALSHYGFTGPEEVKLEFEAAVASGELIYSGYLLYYLSGSTMNVA